MNYRSFLVLSRVFAVFLGKSNFSVNFSLHTRKVKVHEIEGYFVRSTTTTLFLLFRKIFNKNRINGRMQSRAGTFPEWDFSFEIKSTKELDLSDDKAKTIDGTEFRDRGIRWPTRRPLQQIGYSGIYCLATAYYWAPTPGPSLFKSHIFHGPVMSDWGRGMSMCFKECRLEVHRW